MPSMEHINSFSSSLLVSITVTNMILIATSKKTCYGPRLPKGYTASLPALLVTCETELGRGLATVGLQRTALTEAPRLTQKGQGRPWDTSHARSKAAPRTKSGCSSCDFRGQK